MVLAVLQYSGPSSPFRSLSFSFSPSPSFTFLASFFFFRPSRGRGVVDLCLLSVAWSLRFLFSLLYFTLLHSLLYSTRLDSTLLDSTSLCSTLRYTTLHLFSTFGSGGWGGVATPFSPFLLCMPFCCVECTWDAGDATPLRSSPSLPLPFSPSSSLLLSLLSLFPSSFASLLSTH